MSPVIVYGVPFSQPVRAVLWLLMLKREPFELVLTNPGSKGDTGSRNPAFLAKNPAGTIPCIEEPDSGFTLGEAHAIMTYLARTRGWNDLYPQDEQTRARIDAYLHYHHRNVREASIGLVAPNIRKDLNIPQLMQDMARFNLTNALETIERRYLSDHRFLIGDSLSIADIAAYVEIGQLQAQFTNLFDFSDFPNISSWLHNMTQVDGHDEVHEVLIALGDISTQAPAKEDIKMANRRALQVINDTVQTFH